MRALIGELQDAEAHHARGEQAHLAEVIVRLMRVSIARNTSLEERSTADEHTSIRELESLRGDTVEIARRNALPVAAPPAQTEVEARFSAAQFLFHGDRALPTTIIRGGAGDDSFESSFRAGSTWPEEMKHTIIERGWRLADGPLRPTR